MRGGSLEATGNRIIPQEKGERDLRFGLLKTRVKEKVVPPMLL